MTNISFGLLVRYIAIRLFIIAATTIGFAEHCSARERPDFDGTRFRVISGGDALLLPVCVGGRDCLFLIDTGSTWSALDESFRNRLGERIGDATLVTSTGRANADLFAAPQITLAGEPMRDVTKALCLELSTVRAVSGHDIRGIVGMDYLRHRTMRINFDRGELTFFSSVPDDSGVAIPLVYSAEGWPTITLSIDGVSSRLFAIDTGCIGIEGTVEHRLLSRLIDIGCARASGAQGAVSFNQQSTKRTVYLLRAIALDHFQHHAVLFGEGSVNSLGMGYLSRFVVTFDFPHRKMYLKPGALLHEPSRRDLSGARLWRPNGKTAVQYVDVGSAAARAGLKAGDVIEQIDADATESMSLFQIRKLFSRPGKYALQVTRDRTSLQTVLVLDDKATEGTNERPQQR